MLECGNFHGADPLRFNEERTHFGLWCIVSSPLILGFNLSDAAIMDRVWPFITNREAIAIDHGWAGFVSFYFILILRTRMTEFYTNFNVLI